MLLWPVLGAYTSQWTLHVLRVAAMVWSPAVCRDQAQAIPHSREDAGSCLHLSRQDFAQLLTSDFHEQISSSGSTMTPYDLRLTP